MSLWQGWSGVNTWFVWVHRVANQGKGWKRLHQVQPTNYIGTPLCSRSAEEGHLADDHLVERDPESPKVAGKRYPGKPALAEEFRRVKARRPPDPLPALLSTVFAAISIPPDVVERLNAVPTTTDVPITTLILGIQDHARAEVCDFHLRCDQSCECMIPDICPSVSVYCVAHAVSTTHRYLPLRRKGM